MTAVCGEDEPLMTAVDRMLEASIVARLLRGATSAGTRTAVAMTTPPR